MGIDDKNVLASEGGITHAAFRFKFTYIDPVSVVRQVTSEELGSWFVVRAGGVETNMDIFFSLPPPSKDFLGIETRFSTWGSAATALRSFGLDCRDASGSVVGNRITLAGTNVVAEDNIAIGTLGTSIDGEALHYNSTTADPGFFHLSAICVATTDVAPSGADFQWVVFMPQMLETTDLGVVTAQTHYNFT